MGVTAPDLLKGAWYSLEQCGHLLKCAAVLYRDKEYSTAVGVAMLAHEELGKHRILQDEWKKAVQTGKLPSVVQIKNACEDHIEKQRRGQLSVTLITEGPSVLDTAVRTQLKSRPATPDYQAAENVIKSAIEAKVRHAPTERHEKRLNAFFVDLEDSGADWKRPSKTIFQEDAYKLLNGTANDYEGQWDRFSNTALLEDSDLVDALEAWADKPALPLPARPE